MVVVGRRVRYYAGPHGRAPVVFPPCRSYFSQPYSPEVSPNIIRGLVGLVFLFDLYTIYQHLMIYRIRRQLLHREELFHLISENAADMIAVVDMEGKRIF